MQNETTRQYSELRFGRRLLLIATLGFLVFVTMELGARAIFAIKVGPSAMLYGTPWQRSKPAQAGVQKKLTGYTTFFPNEVKSDFKPDSGEKFDVRINSHGFRGPEFAIQKPPNTIRIVTLGASSTFGYHNRDDETYPVYLEQYLNSSNGDSQFEVINLGISSLKSWEISALFVEEALRLDPDIVTFYEGMNDSHTKAKGEGRRPDDKARKQQPQEKSSTVSLVRSGLKNLGNRLLLLKLVRSMIDSEILLPVSQEEYANHIAGKKEAFLQSISAINELCQERGILFIVMKQQGASTLIADLAGVTYEDEHSIVKQKFDDGEPIGFFGLAFLTHKLLMDALENWALENDVPLVNVIELTDDRRDLLWTWVHLRPEANQIIAAGLAEKITDMLPAARP